MMMQKLMNTTLILAASSVLTACGQSTMPAQMVLPQQSFQSQNTQVHQQELIVRFSPEASRHELFNFNQKYGLQTKGFIEGLNAYVVGLRQPLSNQNAFRSLISQMSSESVTTMVEVNQRVQVAPVPYDMMITPIFSN